MYIQNSSGNFSWNQYQIEGQVIPVPALTNYEFQRNDTTIQTLSASSVAYSYPQYSNYSNATFRAKTLWSIICTPTLRINPNAMAASVNGSRSNTFRTGNASVNEISLESAVSIFPNPSNGEFMIRMDNGKLPMTNYQLSIYNVYGEKVLERTVSRKLETINLSEASGFYFVHITTSDQTITKKIVIE
jgi:hypothetical protein